MRHLPHPPWLVRLLPALVGAAVLCAPGAALGSNVWTNAAGRAFSARLDSMTDTHVVLILEDGSRHTLALAALDPASQATARRIANLPAIPVALRSTFAACGQQLRRAAIQHEDGRLTDTEYADMRRRVLSAFRTFYDRHKLPPEDYDALEQRLLRTAREAPPS